MPAKKGGGIHDSEVIENPGRRIGEICPKTNGPLFSGSGVTMNCGIYVRVSTNKQETDNQLLQLGDFARKQGWHIVIEYADQITGKHSNREAFQRMFRDASQRKFDVLLFWSLDRLSREGALETLQHLNRLSSYGIQWRSFTEWYLDSTGVFKEAIVSILATLAKQERIRLSERTKAGLERARKQGKALGRPKASIDASEIRAMRARGLSWGAIGRQTGLARATCQRALQS
jgi:DNA invertase Pin-like site-specific DNA recombinase